MQSISRHWLAQRGAISPRTSKALDIKHQNKKIYFIQRDRKQEKIQEELVSWKLKVILFFKRERSTLVDVT